MQKKKVKFLRTWDSCERVEFPLKFFQEFKPKYDIISYKIYRILCR